MGINHQSIWLVNYFTNMIMIIMGFWLDILYLKTPEVGSPWTPRGCDADAAVVLGTLLLSHLRVGKCCADSGGIHGGLVDQRWIGIMLDSESSNPISLISLIIYSWQSWPSTQLMHHKWPPFWKNMWAIRLLAERKQIIWNLQIGCLFRLLWTLHKNYHTGDIWLHQHENIEHQHITLW